jgi:hypothetical protein
MRHAVKLVATIGLVAAAAITLAGEASSRPWWERVIREQKCAEGNLKKCDNGQRPPTPATAPKEKKAR